MRRGITALSPSNKAFTVGDGDRRAEAEDITPSSRRRLISAVTL
nr:hypothetical protein JMPHXYHW_JMPHXYHW_CDS_0015 [uncultured phage]